MVDWQEQGKLLAADSRPENRQPRRVAPIVQGVVNFCWAVFKWGLLLCVIAVAVGVPYFYRRLDEEIRRQVEARFAQCYPGLRVSIRSAQLVEGEGIEVRDLSISEPGAEGPQAELVHLEEVFLSCRGDLEELIGGAPQITHIRLRRPTLRVTRRPDGRWSAARLLPLPRLSRVPPGLTVENGTVEIFDPLKNPSSTLVLRDVNLRVGPAEATDQDQADPCMRRLEGTCGGDHFRRVELRGLADPHQPRLQIGGTIAGLQISPQWMDSLPEALSSKLAEIRSLRGQADVAFSLGWDSRAGAPGRFEVSGSLAQGRVDDPRLPHALTDMTARFRLVNEGVAVDDLFAHSSQATVWVKSFRRTGFDAASPLTLEAEIKDLELDRQLISVLPPPLARHWPKLFPTGLVRADMKLRYDGRAWQPEVAVDCQNVSFCYYKFPYRLDQAKGQVSVKDDALSVNLRAYAGNQPVQIDGKLFRVSSGPYGGFTVRTEEGEGIELDEKLLAALPEKSRPVVRSLAPRGTAGFFFRAWNEQPGQPPHKYLHVNLNRCSVRYERFPYPLANIRGTLQMEDDRWVFQNLEGTNDTGRVTCNGRFGPGPQGNELALWFQGASIPLEEELRDALKHPNIQRLWNDLRLQGTVDLLGAEVRYLAQDKRLGVAFQARPQPKTTSIELSGFPYRLENLDGILDYRDGQMTIERFRGEHGGTCVGAAVGCRLLTDGSWHVRLDGLAVDELQFNRELVQALPERLRKVVAELNPGGPMSLRGSVEAARGGRPEDRIAARWDLQEVVFHQGSLDFGLKLENISGALRAWGEYDGQRFATHGELDVDSLMFNSLQLTDIHGPLYIDDEQILLGASVAPEPQQQPRSVTAQLFGGTAYGDGRIAVGPDAEYRLRASLAHGDLARYAQEMVPGQQSLRGKIFAAVELWGSGRSLNTLGGRGQIQLRDADVYELPLMISLLKILSVREPDRSAFSESDIDFIVQAGHVYFNRINFRGDAISLVGRGEMDFQTNLNLTFGTRLGSGRLQVPVLSEILGGAGEQIVLIHVQGPLRDPEIWRDPFPGVNKALQQLQEDLGPAGSEVLFPQAGRLLDEAKRLPRRK